MKRAFLRIPSILIPNEIFMPLSRIIIPFFLLTFIFANTVTAYAGDETAIQPWEYKLGEGLRIAATGINIGGYASIKYEDEAGKDGKFIFDDLSLFIFGDISERWSFFSEVEEGHFAEIDTNGNTEIRNNIEIERLYLDYILSDSLNIRAGKFLTPVGTWNEMHADPLTWTVSRPLVTYVPFPEFTTGLQFFGNLSIIDEDAAYSVYLQKNEGIDESTIFRKSHSIYGGRLRWLKSPALEIGIPLLYYKEFEIGDKVYLTGLDFTYKASVVEIRGEGIYSNVDLKNQGWSKEYGYYLQLVCRMTEKHFLVLRHEYLKARGDEGEHRAATIDGVYKLRPQVVFKAEFRIRDGDLRLNGVNDSEQFLSSFSILF